MVDFSFSASFHISFWLMEGGNEWVQLERKLALSPMLLFGDEHHHEIVPRPCRSMDVQLHKLFVIHHLSKTIVKSSTGYVTGIILQKFE